MELIYQTKKRVNVRGTLPFVCRAITYLVLWIYVVVYRCAYEGAHLERVDVFGSSRFYLQGPTKGIPFCYHYELGCEEDYRPFDALPYCSQAQNHTGAEQVRPCKYFEGNYLQKEIPNGGIMIPTRIRRYRKRHFAESARDKDHIQADLTAEIGNGPHYKFLDESNNIETGDIAVPIDDIYVADVEHFAVGIDHSFEMPPAKRSVYKEEEQHHDGMSGYWCDPHKSDAYFGCPENRHDILCINDAANGTTLCPQTSLTPGKFPKRADPLPKAKTGFMLPKKSLQDSLKSEQTSKLEDYPILSTKYGNSFRMDSLLQLAGVEFEHASLEKNERNLREAGGTLILHIDYGNTFDRYWGGAWLGFRVLRWHTPPPDYTFSVSYVPQRGNVEDVHIDFKTVGTANSTEEVIKWTGIRLEIRQEGQIAVWSDFAALFILISVTGLMAMANTLLDMTLIKFGGKYGAAIVENPPPRQEEKEEDPDGIGHSLSSDSMAAR